MRLIVALVVGAAIGIGAGYLVFGSRDSHQPDSDVVAAVVADRLRQRNAMPLTEIDVPACRKREGRERRQFVCKTVYRSPEIANGPVDYEVIATVDVKGRVTTIRGIGPLPDVMSDIGVSPVAASAPRSPVPLCNARDFAARLEVQGATGGLMGGVELRKVSGATCSLNGWPGVRFAGPGASSVPLRVIRNGEPKPVDTLSRGDVAGVDVDWLNWCPHGTPSSSSSAEPPTALVLTFPEDGGTVSAPAGVRPRCDDPPSGTLLRFGPFTTR